MEYTDIIQLIVNCAPAALAVIGVVAGVVKVGKEIASLKSEVREATAQTELKKQTHLLMKENQDLKRALRDNTIALTKINNGDNYGIEKNDKI